MTPQLKMSVVKIRNKIDLNIHPWENVSTSNCYAFALGLDVPRGDIIDEAVRIAYRPGMIASVKLKIPPVEFKTLSIEDRLLLDLKVLKIAVQEADPKDESYVDMSKRFEKLSWIISRYKTVGDFHFARKTTDQEWWHKMGYLYRPEKLENGTDPIFLTDEDDGQETIYEHVKTYRLTMMRKKRGLN